jgi:large subunit ribosomal protein L31
MKKDIHPFYYKDAKITCSCGYELTAGSIKKEMQVEICSHCHPLYTGKKKMIDTARRVEKFAARLEKTKVIQEKKKSKESKRKTTKRNIKKV